MLDQNTDRMWYVIGALVVGAGIILLANKAMPGVFANVSDRVMNVANNGLGAITDLVVYGEEDGNFTSENYFMWETIHYDGESYLGTDYGQDVVTITGYRYDGPTSISIPETINDKPVVSISEKAFSETQIKNITMPDSIVYIGKSAFYNSPIETLHFSNNIKEIDDAAFKYTNMKSVEMPSKLEIIGNEAFSSAPITNVKLNDGLKVIKDGAFTYTNIEKVTLPASLESIAKGSFNLSPLNEVTAPNDLVIPSDTFASYVRIIRK